MQSPVLDRLDSLEMSSIGIMGTWGGRMAPDFEIPALDGQRMGLETVRGKVVLLNFWSTGCEASIRQMPSLERLYRLYQKEAFTLFAVNLRESAAKVEDFRNEFRITFPILLDRIGEVGETYGVSAIPTTFILDRQGIMIGKTAGARNWTSAPVRCLIQELLFSR